MKNGKPNGTKVEKTTKGNRQTVERATFNTLAGSRKATVAGALQASGKAAAMDKGEELGLKRTTLKSWISAWTRQNLISSETQLRANHRKRTAQKAQKQTSQTEQQTNA